MLVADSIAATGSLAVLVFLLIGRLAARNAIQYSTVPLGIILGGCLADYVFEPFMESGNKRPGMLGTIIGGGTGSGMAAMFLCTGICGFTVSMVSCFNREIKKLD